jgi:serine protease AprX
MAKSTTSLRSLALLLTILVFGTAAEAQFSISLPLPPPQPSPQTLGKLDPLLQPRLSNFTGRSKVIVRAVNVSSIGPVRTLVQQLGGILGRQLPLIEATVADVPNLSLLLLANNPLVQRVALDRLIAGTTERTGATVGATDVRQAFGYDGSGIGVAVIDSGVTGWHDDLAQGFAGPQRVDQFVDFVNGRTAPYDDYGHGTHVAGIIAGNGFDSSGRRSGMAPAARLVVLKVLDQAGRGRISNVIAAFDYVVAHKDAFNIRIVNLSVAAGVFESYNTDVLTLAARRAVDRGIVVVAAAGNAGRNPQGRKQYGGITAPGNAPWVLTVGASSHMGTIDRADDTVATFSSRGPTAIDRAAKPDLVAPGVGIESLSAPGSTLFESKSAYLLNGTVPRPYPPYLSLSGTSQATPVVAGTVALMLEANPDLTPNAVKALLQYTAQKYAGYHALSQGAGFLNARGAVDLARYFAGPLTAPYPSTAGWSRQLIWGTRRVKGGRLTPTANAWATTVVWGTTTVPGGQTATWGVMCATDDCEESGTGTWGRACSGPDCTENETNIVWGSACGGADCQDRNWSPSDDAIACSSDTSEDTVVWGTSDENEDTVVWGTSDENEDTVVWGTSAPEDVVWDCNEPSCNGGN